MLTHERGHKDTRTHAILKAHIFVSFMYSRDAEGGGADRYCRLYPSVNKVQWRDPYKDHWNLRGI